MRYFVHVDAVDLVNFVHPHAYDNRILEGSQTFSLNLLVFLRLCFNILTTWQQEESLRFMTHTVLLFIVIVLSRIVERN